MGVVKAVSILVPTEKELDRYDMKKLCDVLDNGDYDSYEIILCTSAKCRGIRQSNILHTNLSSSIKCCFTNKRGMLNIMKCGLSLCKYSDVIVLQDDIEGNTDIIRKLMNSHTSSNRHVYVSSNGMIAMSLYAITSVLNVCKTGSILEMLNVCDYLRFSITKVQAKGVSIIDFDTFAESNDLSSKLKKKREKKSFQRKLVSYCY